MKSQIAMFAILSFAAIFAMLTPFDVAVAETNAVPDGDGEYEEGHEGKSCPSKEKKTAYFSESNI